MLQAFGHDPRSRPDIRRLASPKRRHTHELSANSPPCVPQPRYAPMGGPSHAVLSQGRRPFRLNRPAQRSRSARGTPALATARPHASCCAMLRTMRPRRPGTSVTQCRRDPARTSPHQRCGRCLDDPDRGHRPSMTREARHDLRRLSEPATPKPFSRALRTEGAPSRGTTPAITPALSVVTWRTQSDPRRHGSVNVSPKGKPACAPIEHTAVSMHVGADGRVQPIPALWRDANHGDIARAS